MRRIAIVSFALMALTGCTPGSVFKDLGISTAGSADVNTQHVPGFDCPNFNAQGSVEVSSFHAHCRKGADGSFEEAVDAGNVNPVNALAAAAQAQAQMTKAITDMVSTLIPVLEKLVPTPTPNGPLNLNPNIVPKVS